MAAPISDEYLIRLLILERQVTIAHDRFEAFGITFDRQVQEGVFPDLVDLILDALGTPESEPEPESPDEPFFCRDWLYDILRPDRLEPLTEKTAADLLRTLREEIGKVR